MFIFAAAGCSLSVPSVGSGGNGYLYAEFMIAGEAVRLLDGVAETQIPGSSARVVTRYYGKDLHHDIDSDGLDDVVFLLTRQTGGSATFFFVVAALQRPGGWEGSQGMLLGDRIAPHTIEPGIGTRIIVNFADRAPAEPFTTPPSWERSLRLLLDPVDKTFSVETDDSHGGH